MSPLKALCFLWLVAEVEMRDLKQEKDLIWHCWLEDEGGHIERT